MNKRSSNLSNEKKIVLLGFISLLIVISLMPIVNAEVIQINTGFYYYNNNTKDVISVSSNWTVNSGSPIDVFLLTQAQLDLWTPHQSLPPPSATYSWLSSTNGSFEQPLNPGETYYAIFSNINGAATSYVDVQVQWTFKPSGGSNFDIILIICFVLLPILILLLVALSIIKRRQQKAVVAQQDSMPIFAEFIYCIRCGSKNLKTAKFCKVCGATIE